MTAKQQRWYEIEGDMAYIYDAPWRDFSLSVSIVPKDQLSWYRAHFQVERVWTNRPVEA